MPQPEREALLYRRDCGRREYLTRAFLWHVKRVVAARAKKHIADARKQLVVFSFDYVANNINFDGVYERDALDSFFDWLRTLGVDTRHAAAIDIGANIGNHSLYFSDHFENVYSFEPNPRTYQVLRLNAELAKNVHCWQIGLSDRNGSAAMRIPPHNIGGASIGDKWEHSAQSIEVRTLDSLLPDVEKVRLIKVDVEGHEYQAISGSRKLIKAHRPIILFEQHLVDFRDGRSPVISLLQELGYENFAILKKYPRVAGGYRMNVLAAPFLRLLLGESVRIKLVNHIQPDFYSFIIALPEWFPIAGIRLKDRKITPGLF
jgi:FkbM family methyltransferase